MRSALSGARAGNSVAVINAGRPELAERIVLAMVGRLARRSQLSVRRTRCRARRSAISVLALSLSLAAAGLDSPSGWGGSPKDREAVLYSAESNIWEQAGMQGR